MDATQVKTKLIGYGFSLLEGVDPNPEVKNYPIYFKFSCLLYFQNSFSPARPGKVPGCHLASAFDPASPGGAF